MRALQRAADRGKQVTAVIELKARLDEERNILWAKELEKAGVHVVFGFVGLKTHCKVALVVRRDEDNAIRRYVHLGTGNYNPQTARIYTDLGLFTCNPDFADDVTALFNYLTGYAELPQWRKLLVAPSRLQTFMIEKIDREAANQQAGKPARILAKVNGLLEPAVVKALYRASQAGVKIDIVCRGICSLRPGIPGVSENIRVISVVDRFLEHSRIFYFENAGDPEVYVGSADWMDRNLSRRVEVVFPIEQPDLKQRVIDILKMTLADNVKARELLPDGTYRRVKPAEGRAGAAEPDAVPGAGGRGRPRPPAAPEPVAAPDSARRQARNASRAAAIGWSEETTPPRIASGAVSSGARASVPGSVPLRDADFRDPVGPAGLDLRARRLERRGRRVRAGSARRSGNPTGLYPQSLFPPMCWQPSPAANPPSTAIIAIFRRMTEPSVARDQGKSRGRRRDGNRGTAPRPRRRRGRVRRTGSPPPCANHRRPGELRLLPRPTRRRLYRPPGFAGFTRFRELAGSGLFGRYHSRLRTPERHPGLSNGLREH